MPQEKNILVNRGIPRKPSSPFGFGFGAGGASGPDHSDRGYDLMDSATDWLNDNNAYTEKLFNENIKNIFHITDAELAKTRAAVATVVPPGTDALEIELRTLKLQLFKARTDHQEQIRIANLYYGHDPLTKGFEAPAGRRSGQMGYYRAVEKWNISYAAAYEAKFLAEQIKLLDARLATQNNAIAEANAKAAAAAQARAQAEARRVAEEQARMAAEEANRLAAIQAEQHRQQAIAEAARRQKEQEEIQAREQARLAALENARRAAVEQARVAAQAAAQQVAAEQEAQRAAAEEARNAQQKRVAEKKRAERDAWLKYLDSWTESLETDQANRPFPVSGSAASVVPVFTVAAGSIFTPANNLLAIKAALRAAVAAVISALATSSSVVIGGFAALMFPSPLGNSELYALSVPLSDLTLIDPDGLYDIAEANGEIDLPVSIGSRTVDDTIEFIVAATNGATVPSKVPVRLATHDPDLNVYRSYNPDTPSIGMTWTPIVKPKNASTTLPARESRIYIYNGTTPASREGRLDEFPELDLYSFGGFINVFPAESGIPPIYTMFRDRRDDPGVASGFGQEISGAWLGAASLGEGAPIPTQIADKLRGRDFSSFRAFREALWRAASDDTDLAKQFTANNIREMKNGRAPFARKNDRLGGQVKFELHHVNRVSRGGEIYDIDNIRAITPKRHSELHKGGN